MRKRKGMVLCWVLSLVLASGYMVMAACEYCGTTTVCWLEDDPEITGTLSPAAPKCLDGQGKTCAYQSSTIEVTCTLDPPHTGSSTKDVPECDDVTDPNCGS